MKLLILFLSTGMTMRKRQRRFYRPRILKLAGDWFEYVWRYYTVDYHAPMPYEGETHPKRIVVKLYNTGIPGMPEGWATSAESMNLHPNAMFYGSTVVPHEFCHVIQFYSKGFRDRASVGAWWETHAEREPLILHPPTTRIFPSCSEILTRVASGRIRGIPTGRS